MPTPAEELRQRCLEEAVRTANPMDQTDTIVKRAAAFENYIRNGKVDENAAG